MIEPVIFWKNKGVSEIVFVPNFPYRKKKIKSPKTFPRLRRGKKYGGGELEGITLIDAKVGALSKDTYSYLKQSPQFLENNDFCKNKSIGLAPLGFSH